jgi:hypothetical protein
MSTTTQQGTATTTVATTTAQPSAATTTTQPVAVQGAAQNQKTTQSVVPPITQTPDSAKDPISIMIKIIKDPDIDDADKTTLITYCQSRFKHRRRIAYISLWTIIGSVFFVFAAALFDGMPLTGDEKPSTILSVLGSNSGFLGTVEGLLAAIVGAYYGISGWKPSS